MALFSLNNDKIKELIQRRMLQIRVHSFLYYEMNESIISDAKWSKWAMELVGLMKKYPNVVKQIPHHELFADFDGSTGFQFVATADDRLITKAYLLAGKLGKDK